MSLFQCSECGCVENTALCNYSYITCGFWDELKGKMPCSACTPDKFNNGTNNIKGGKWHGKFERIYLPKGMFKTNRHGNLEHIKTGETDLEKYAIDT